MSLLLHAPSFSLADAERTAWERYGRRGPARALTSERDQNFLIEDVERGAIVLKIANALEERALLEAQQQAMARLAQRGVPVPRVVPATDGEPLIETTSEDGNRHLTWAVTPLPGVLLADAGFRSPELLEQLGGAVGLLTSALNGFTHPALDRTFVWDLTSAVDGVLAARSAIDDAAFGAAVDGVVDRVREHVLPYASELPRAAIHNDLNDHNILVAATNDAAARLTRVDQVTGIIDFGDMSHSALVIDPAVVVESLVMGRQGDDVFRTARLVLDGYQRVTPLEPQERAIFGELVAARACASVVVPASRASMYKDDGASVMAEIRAALDRVRVRRPELRADAHVTVSQGPSDVGVEAPIVQALDRAIRGAGGAIRVEGMSAWTDAAILNEAGIPAICFGPGDIALAHAAEEYVSIDEIGSATDILARLARDWCGGS